MLEKLIPVPRKAEVDSVDLAADVATVWKHVRHADLGDTPFTRALFAVRTLPSRIRGTQDARDTRARMVCIDDLRSTRDLPGFQLLLEDEGHEFAVGAIGKVWHLDIPFVHVDGPKAFSDFHAPGWVKVAWSVRLEPLGDASTRLFVEVRVDATDDASWDKFTKYWLLIGPGSHFIRRTLLAGLRRRFGDPDGHEEDRALPGDELLRDAAGQLTEGITVRAKPEAIWPWLVQMGCHRGGFYAIDALDNGGTSSAWELRPELQRLVVGDVIPATPDGHDGFEVLAVEPQRALVLGGLFDADAKKQRPFASERPKRYWQVTWAFVLEPLDESTTRLHVRARAAFSRTERLHAAWIRPVHALMQAVQLRHLRARAESVAPDQVAACLSASRLDSGESSSCAATKERTHAASV